MTPYESDRMKRLEKSQRELSAQVDKLGQQNLMWQEVVAYSTEHDEANLPLWKRIANQRRALRHEVSWRMMYERWWRESNRENSALKLRVKELEERLAA